MNGPLCLGKASLMTKVKWKLYFFIVLALWMNSCENRLGSLHSLPQRFTSIHETRSQTDHITANSEQVSHIY